MKRIAIYIICIISLTLLIYNQVLINEIKVNRIEKAKLKFKLLDLETD